MANKRNLKTWLVMAAIFLGLGCATAVGDVIYVDEDALFSGNGVTWETAYKYLQEALRAARSGDEIRVAEGVYKPDEDTAHPNGSGSRYATFRLKNGVAIKGGYAGFGEPNPNERDPNTYETTLSGDLRENDGPNFANNGENSYHVVTGSWINATAVLDGFTITAGNAGSGMGGGMYNEYESSPTLTNCTFSGNSAGWAGGGGMYNYRSSPTLTNCTFSGNSAAGWGGGMRNSNSGPTLTNCIFSDNSAQSGGSGMYNEENSSPTLANCTFSGNSADWEGGGMYNEHSSSPTLTNCTFIENWAAWGGGMNNGEYSNPTLIDCTFSDNSAQGGGGMINNRSSSPMLTNCTFIGNWAGWAGGGMYNEENSNPTLTNCTLSDNSAQGGGGMHNYESSPMLTNCTFSSNSAEWGGGGMANEAGSPTLTNCTFSGNSADGGSGMYNEENSSPTLANCTFSGNSARWEGGGMYNETGSPTLTNCTFSGNSARWGGGMNNSDSSPTLTNCTFSSNSAEWGGGGMCSFWESSPTLTNCILWGNTAPSGSQIYNDWASSATVSYTDVQGGWPGTGNKNADPLFINASSGDLWLLPTSPCIDAGDNTAVPAGVTTDLRGNPRFVDQPEVPDTGNGTAPIVDMGAYEANYIEVAMKFTPQALNLKSKGKWVKAHFVLPEGFLPEDVDTNTPAVIAPLGIESDHINVFINEENLVEIEAAFSRSDFCRSATSNDDAEVIVIGLLNSGQDFYGTDTIKITNRSFEYLAIFVSYWLEAGCSSPDWCAGLDLNQDSVINFIDFAMFDGCCFEVIKDE